MSFTPTADEIINADTFYGFVQAHAHTYIESGLAVTVTGGSGTSTSVSVAVGKYYIGGTRYDNSGILTKDLSVTGFYPPTNDYYNYVIVWIDSSGVLQVTEGTEVDVQTALRVGDVLVGANGYIGTNTVGCMLAKIELHKTGAVDDNLVTANIRDTCRFVKGTFPIITDGSNTLSFANIKAAYDERGTAIAGYGLDWDGSELDFNGTALAGTNLTWDGTQFNVTDGVIDADTLDSYHAVSFPRKAEGATIASAWTFSSLITASAGIGLTGTLTHGGDHNITGNINMTGNITGTIGTIDTVDLAAFKSTYDTHATSTPSAHHTKYALLDDLTSTGKATMVACNSAVSGTEWSYVATMNQHVATGYSPTFAALTISTTLGVTGTSTLGVLVAGAASFGSVADGAIQLNLLGTSSVYDMSFRGYNATPDYWTLVLNSGGVKLVDGATSWTSASDMRFKDNIVSVPTLDKILALDTIEYDLWENDEEGKRREVAHQIGVSAQALREQFPMLVFGEETETEQLSVDYSHMSALFIGAFKEMQEKIDVLSARIAELEVV